MVLIMSKTLVQIKKGIMPLTSLPLLIDLTRSMLFRYLVSGRHTIIQQFFK